MFVKLVREQIFHDASQGITVTGTSVVKVKPTAKVMGAIRARLLEEVKGKELEAEKPADIKPKSPSKMNKPELQELLKSKGIEFAEDNTKGELLTKLTDAEAEEPENA